MPNYAYFQMWEPQRKSLIWTHTFYYEQGKKRLLAQFDDIGGEANAETEKWMVEQSRVADPDGDFSDVYEDANDHNSEVYYLLQEMRDSTRLSLLAGMFHEWEKQVRNWLVTESRHWHSGDEVKSSIWKVQFEPLMDLFNSMGWDIKAAAFYPKLEACRLVVNVYKHGSGQSFDDLVRKYSQYVRGAFENGAFQQVQAELRRQQLAAGAKQEEVTKLNQEGAHLVAELAHTKQSLYEQLTNGRKLEQKIEQLQTLLRNAENIERQLASKIAKVELLGEQLNTVRAESATALARSRELELELAQANAKAEVQEQIGDQFRAYLDKIATRPAAAKSQS
ncbi:MULTISPECIES: hypothetical protein [unclassified Duganella]|uniref:hypothetical protein n=1 Tax=unclassified Duganella TaxID=2636909 RepID=UPI00088EAE46|nr:MULTISPECIES: hypothetical protein [unclassified Duganella]SDG83446.1 hypothetical protein SAMN05216320_107233 [Duganella sp. OV458]SDK10868.1 hypothetical protein SAMN05428973_108234 [Duganella sp. OV510]